MGFWPDVQRILAALPPARQTLLFSATMPGEVLKLTQEFLRDPKYVQVGRRGGPAQTITPRDAEVAAEREDAVAGEVAARARPTGPVLVFCRTKIGAERLADAPERHGHPRRGAARRPHAAAADGGGRRVPHRDLPGAGRHRRRRARPRHRGHRARRQLRSARHARGVRAPRRPHRPRRINGERADAGGSRRRCARCARWRKPLAFNFNNDRAARPARRARCAGGRRRRGLSRRRRPSPAAPACRDAPPVTSDNPQSAAFVRFNSCRWQQPPKDGSTPSSARTAKSSRMPARPGSMPMRGARTASTTSCAAPRRSARPARDDYSY